MLMEQVLAVLVAGVCAAMLVRLLLPTSHRTKLDQHVKRKWALTFNAVKRPFRGRAARQAEALRAEQARQAMAEAIERARRASRAAEVVREGNVYKPEAFKQRGKPH